MGRPLMLHLPAEEEGRRVYLVKRGGGLEVTVQVKGRNHIATLPPSAITEIETYLQEEFQ